MPAAGSDLNSDWGSLRHPIKKSNDIGVAHADAAVACGGANQALPIGAVDVDVAGLGVLVFGVYSCQPEDAGLDVVAAFSFDSDFTGGDAADKNGAFGSGVSNFSGDLKAARGRSVASGFEADTEFRSGNGEGFEELPLRIEKVEGLRGNMNADLHRLEEGIRSRPFL